MDILYARCGRNTPRRREPLRHGGSVLLYVPSPEVFQQKWLERGEVSFLGLRPLREGPTCAVPVALPHTRTGATVPPTAH